MKLVRNILLPVVPIYHVITWLRNRAYDNNILYSKKYNFPIITVGNLSVGGTGKSPMIEYLIRLLRSDYKIATLSRGYKRNTEGFVIADKDTSALSVGDEPFQFYNKFEDVIISVDADRQNGIEQLQRLNPKPDVILLDDAFQHRKVEAGLVILLTTYNKLYIDDFVLPTGNLREPKSGAKRADIIIVTKCPSIITEIEKQQIVTRLKPKKHQQVFFSSIQYSKSIYALNSERLLSSLNERPFTLVTGIANSKPLVEFLNAGAFTFEHLNFKDHHEFSSTEIAQLKQKYLILTTEKDFMRLKDKLNSDSLYYLPIESEVFESERFNVLVKQFVSKI